MARSGELENILFFKIHANWAKITIFEPKKLQILKFPFLALFGNDKKMVFGTFRSCKKAVLATKNLSKIEKSAAEHA